MLATGRCKPQKLRLVVVELQTVRLRPVGDIVDTLGDSRQKHVDVRRRAGAIYLCVVRVKCGDRTRLLTAATKSSDQNGANH